MTSNYHCASETGASTTPLTLSHGEKELDGATIVEAADSQQQQPPPNNVYTIGSGILKHQRAASVAVCYGNSSPRVPPQNVGGIQWDEQTIAEHDKDRGTRMKIDEPSTPYHHCESMDDLDGSRSASTSCVVSMHTTTDPLAAPNSFPMSDGVAEKIRAVETARLQQEKNDSVRNAVERSNHSSVCPAVLRQRLEALSSDFPLDATTSLNDFSSDLDDLRNTFARSRSRSVHLSGEILDYEDQDQSEEEMFRKKKFAQQRKLHYNEFYRAKELMNSGSLDVEDSDGDCAK